MKKEFSTPQNVLLLPLEEEKPAEIIEDKIDSNNTWTAGNYFVNGKMGFYKMTMKDGVGPTDSVPAIFDNVALIPGNNELLLVKQNGREGVITLKNQEVIPLKFDEVKPVYSTLSHGIIL